MPSQSFCHMLKQMWNHDKVKSDSPGIDTVRVKAFIAQIKPEVNSP